jgi:hypothetical protein
MQKEPESGGPVLTKTEAREGVTGNNVRYVLLWSLIGAIAVFIIAYLYF